MFFQLWNKIKESLMSVLPVSLITLVLSFTPLFDLSVSMKLIFIFSSIALILGISLFNLGADMAMGIMGEQVGSSLMKTKKIWLILAVLFFMGLLITIAEPDLSVLAKQVKNALPGKNQYTLIITIGLGVGLFLAIAILKIIFKRDLSMLLMFFYLALFALTALLMTKDSGNTKFLSLAYDSGGVTTGPITVPFIMALGLGIATTVGGRNAKENSFGLVSLCSIGPILAVLLLGLAIKSDNLVTEEIFDLTTYELNTSKIASILGHALIHSMKNVAIALFLIVGFFLIIDLIFIKLPKKRMIQIKIGIIYTYFGLVIFLTAAEIGFLSVGYKMGEEFAKFGDSHNTQISMIIVAFVLGFVVVLAEPAVHVLTKQVEEVTMGAIKKKTMLIALCIGVGTSICLSIIRIVYNFSILYYIIPGYIISLGLSLFVPRVYTAIAFDSGGVASGPLTSSFVLPFAIGACAVLHREDLLQNAFGVVAMVAMTPLITIQLLGFKSVMTSKVKTRNRIKRIINADDEQIIRFN